MHLIWDLPLRLFHWLLVLSIAASWYTSKQDNGLIDYHLLTGYFTLGLIVFRLLWGFFGTTHAKFRNFIPSFKKVSAYIRHFNSDAPEHYPGHNPLGSLMVFFMLAVILLQAVSGLFMNDEIFTSGPYSGAINGKLEAIFITIHRHGFDYILAAIALHVFAVLYYVSVKKQALISAIITGKKSAQVVNKKDSISRSKLGLAILISLLVAAFVYWLVVINAPVIEDYYY
ncbi:Cytochrome b [Colwellia chukchiensis]|uniref:Cytochrome b n=1 Tax=Colwellia chukchiensis TaxID=641665 RepID=A0A1H7GGE9_9GAMM|nr:cytochrome b/b6 domain-containing protein [Colwellia chukchiensis]SEK34845.1 Cytochrome b [Colwellia chukchiensis]